MYQQYLMHSRSPYQWRRSLVFRAIVRVILRHVADVGISDAHTYYLIANSRIALCNVYSITVSFAASVGFGLCITE